MEPNPKKLNICFCPSDSTGVFHYRCQTLAKYFERYNLANTRVLYNTTYEWDDFMWADVFIFQRKISLLEHDNFLLEAIRVRAEIKKTHPEYRLPFIYDIDDNLHVIPKTNPVFDTYNKNDQQALKGTEAWMRSCDAVMVSTPNLGSEYARFAKKIVVRRNLIDPEMFEANKAIIQDKEGRLRIVYAGSNTHYEDLKMIAPPLRKILNRFQHVELVVFGAGDKSSTSTHDLRELLEGCPRVTYQPYVFTRNYFMRLKGLNPDIGICPLFPSKFNAAKSAIKFYEYTLAGAAAIASNVGQYPEVFEHNENGLLANSVNEWEQHLITLIKSEPTRRRLLKNADAMIRIEHGVNTRTIREMYDQLLRLHSETG